MKNKRYKFFREGFKSEYGAHTWEIGKWYKHIGKLDMCNAGFHCSKRMGEALSYVQGEIVAEVECRGESIIGDDKEVWEEMRIVKCWKWTKTDSVKLAIFAAEQVIDIYEMEQPKDDRPRKAIEAAKNWLDNPTEENGDVARAASWAARVAARYAGYARAARYAARVASWAARCAGYAWAAWVAGAVRCAGSAAAGASWDEDVVTGSIYDYMEGLTLEEIK